MRSLAAAAGLLTFAASALAEAPHPQGTPALVTGQVAGYSPDTANEEAYWYSRYSMMTLTMQSGLGVSIPMDQNFMSMMQSMMTAVGPAASDPVMAPVNPSLLAVIYAGGDPHYATAPNQLDFATLHWKGGPARLTTEATAVTMTKELEWAKLFHRDAHFGQAGVDTFGSSQRFVGMVLATMVKMQLAAYLGNADHYEDSLAGDYALLIAFSDGADLYGTGDQANTQGPNAAPPSYPPENRYADAAAAQQFRGLADAQFEIVASTHPRSARDLSLGVQSVIWYAAISTDGSAHKRARSLVDAWAGRLAAMRDERPASIAYRVRGLIEAGRVTRSERYLTSAARGFNQMLEGFDTTYGVLRGSRRLSIDDVAEIAGAFNAAQLWLGLRIDQARANAVFGAWWEGTVNLSGLEISSPALSQMKGTYELLDPPGRGITLQNPLDYRYPTVPMPSLAGGPYGAAPVLAASVTWNDDRKTWSADQKYFDTAGAMHAADEFIWFHSDEINGFPNVSLP